LFLIIILFDISALSKITAQNIPRSNKTIASKKQKDPKEKLALNFYLEKDYEKASELFQQLYNDKQSNYYYIYYFNSLVAIKNYKQAEKLAKQQKKLNPNNYKYLIDEAYVTELSGNKKKADRILNKIINNLPSKRNQIIQITSSLQSKGYAKIAIKVFKKAKLMSDNYSYNFEIANAYLYSGDYDRMFDTYIILLDQNPDDIQRVKNKLQYIMRMDVNSNLSEILKSKLLYASQQNPDKIQLAEMLLWYSLQTKDFSMAFRQARAIDRRFGNRDKDMLELADIAFSNYDFIVSEKAYGYIKDKKTATPYYADSYVGYFLSVIKLVEENPTITRKNYEDIEKVGIKALEILGINNTTSIIVINLADITAFKLSKNNEASEMIEETLANPTINKFNKAYLKLKLADIMVANDNIWDATLLYSQVESDMKNEPVGHEAKLKNAKVFYYAGEFDWANTRLDILKSATSKLISNDAIELSVFINNMREEDTIGFVLRKFAGADLYTYQGKYDSAMMLLDKIEEEPAGIYSMEYMLYNKAQLYYKMSDFKNADSVYNRLITHYPGSIKADNALFKRAEIQRTRFNNNDEAKNLYMILMTDYPESIYSGKARKQYRMLVEE